MIETFDFFPTKFFVKEIEDKNLVTNIAEEVYSNQEKIKSISWANEEQDSEIYATDFCDRVQIKSFELLMEDLKQEFANQYQIEVRDFIYWTSFYKKFSAHQMHSHQAVFIEDYNYSGILYLNSIGSTEFFSVNPCSFQSRETIPSKLGRIVMFPSNLPHQTVSRFDSDVERCIIAFNMNIGLL